jgi:hypothetical protein
MLVALTMLTVKLNHFLNDGVQNSAVSTFTKLARGNEGRAIGRSFCCIWSRGGSFEDKKALNYFIGQ